jgi:hypothetical protein
LQLQGESNKTTFLVRDWLWLIVIVSGASVTNMGMIYSVSLGLRNDMLELDQRWQDRTEKLTISITEDIKEIRKQIPPDWFREMVDRNTEEIFRLNREWNEHIKNSPEENP